MPYIQKFWILRSILNEVNVHRADRAERQNFCRQISALGPHAKSAEFLEKLEQLDLDIPKQLEKLVFDCVGFASKLLSSLVPCLSAMVIRSGQKF